MNEDANPLLVRVSTIMKFSLEIELGNEAMESPWDVQHALVATANKIRLLSGSDWQEESGKIFDLNGNRVGTWKFEE